MTWIMQSAVVPVTFAASGIGLAICHALRREGAVPLTLDVDEQRLATAAKDVYADGGNPERHAYVVDVSDSVRVEACFKQMRHTHGVSTHAVAAAGVAGRDSALTVSDARWHRVVDINLHGVMYFCRAAANQLIESRRGSIVVVTSMPALLAKRIVLHMLPPRRLR